MGWGWGGGQGHVRELPKDNEKGDGLMELCVNDAQSVCWGTTVLLPEWQRGHRGDMAWLWWLHQGCPRCRCIWKGVAGSGQIDLLGSGNKRASVMLQILYPNSTSTDHLKATDQVRQVHSKRMLCPSYFRAEDTVPILLPSFGYSLIIQFFFNSSINKYVLLYSLRKLDYARYWR